MSRWGKIFWLMSGLSLLILVSIRFVIGGWIDYFWIPLGLFLAGFIGALVADFKLYLELFTMRTTKHGMNMGALILTSVAILVSINFLAVRKDKTIDLTEEKLFSLAPQSVDLVNRAEKDINVLVFYRGKKDAQAREEIKGSLSLYEDVSSKVKIRFYDAFVERAKADEYLRGQADTAQPVVFIEYEGKRVKIEPPFSEQSITSAMIKATRKGAKKIYFLTGHGERNIEADDAEGLKDFVAALKGSSYEVASLNLLETGKIPEDAAVIAIVGPQLQILESEFDLMSDYARKGGRFFIAADPGLRHQIPLFLRRFGVEYKNNYIINDRIQLTGRGATGALGLIFDRGSPITKMFSGRDNFTLFDAASEVVPAKDGPPSISVLELVKTPPVAFSVNTLSQNMSGDRRMISIGVIASGKWPAQTVAGSDGKTQATEPSDKFKAVVFGDSDFVSQKDFVSSGLNSDLALNSIAELADEVDLISITPKQPKGTTLKMTSTQGNLVVVAGLSLPIILIILAGVLWYRRRSA